MQREILQIQNAKLFHAWGTLKKKKKKKKKKSKFVIYLLGSVWLEMWKSERIENSRRMKKGKDAKYF